METYADGAAAPFAAGAVLFPWPNRVRGARWVHRGVEQQLVVNEAELGNANHGLVRDKRFTVVDQGADHVTICATVDREPGYPFTVTLQITYRLTDSGITVDSLVSNGSAEPAPVALGAHPYVRIGDVPVEDLMLRVPADVSLPVDAQLIPGAPAGVDGTALDWRTARRIADAELNTCFALDRGRGTDDDARSRSRRRTGASSTCGRTTTSATRRSTPAPRTPIQPGRGARWPWNRCRPPATP